jgi:hypothetical protein
MKVGEKAGPKIDWFPAESSAAKNLRAHLMSPL